MNTSAFPAKIIRLADERVTWFSSSFATLKTIIEKHFAISYKIRVISHGYPVTAIAHRTEAHKFELRTTRCNPSLVSSQHNVTAHNPSAVDPMQALPRSDTSSTKLTLSMKNAKHIQR
ncbi:hypothetical protein KC19_6G212200 [Ceratodon purpureus]|uniref:Uncharacterized protein n=1 Tax=Ceratodon purpureus TaxID=3225 RepID=A0A8T0HK15_CERPU|nr:hypothetical protein KC19_6G212200 [Ceratodon purpureus]